MPALRITRKTEPGRRRPGYFVCTIVVLLSTAFAAAAQVRASGDYLLRMDADHDGRIALLEFQDWLSYAFDAMDKDHDGLLVPSELPGGRGKPVLRSEHRATLAAAFKRQDGNGDGFLSAKELAAPPR